MRTWGWSRSSHLSIRCGLCSETLRRLRAALAIGALLADRGLFGFEILTEPSQGLDSGVMQDESQCLGRSRDFGGQEVPVPSVGENDVLVRVEACGVCFSEFHTWPASTGSRSLSRSQDLLAHPGGGGRSDGQQVAKGLQTYRAEPRGCFLSRRSFSSAPGTSSTYRRHRMDTHRSVRR
jgi:hypothetical protein